MKATCDHDKSVSVIIPVFNSQKTIEVCLEAVFRSSFKRFEVIVVDDGSTDDSAAISRRFPCHVIQLEKQSGPGAARNAGARGASAGILFFLDSDILIEPDTISLIIDSFRDRPDISGLFCSYQKDTIPSNFCSTYKNLLHHFIHQTSREEASTFCGGFGALTKDAFLSVGGFNETYKGIQVTHCKTYSLLGLIKSDVLNRAIPWTRIMISKWVFKNDLNTRIHHVISVPVSFLILILIPLSFPFPLGIPILILLMVSLLVLNHSFLMFVFREKGAAFTLQTVIMSWFGYLYSGAGLVLALIPYARERGGQEKL